MAKRKTRTGPSIYQLKITLAEIRPPVWRRIQVPGNTKLPDLHLMIQAAMGWYNCHLHKFTIGGVEYSDPDPDWDDLDYEDETRARLDQAVSRAGISFSYLYDFGDGWEHDILVEEILEPSKGVEYPICLAGERACPPEDVGGVWGYHDFLEAIADPKHEEHESYLEWGGGEFDLAAFDVEETNAVLEDYKQFDSQSP